MMRKCMCDCITRQSPPFKSPNAHIHTASLIGTTTTSNPSQLRMQTHHRTPSLQPWNLHCSNEESTLPWPNTTPPKTNYHPQTSILNHHCPSKQHKPTIKWPSHHTKNSKINHLQPPKIIRQTIESSPITKKKWKKFGALILTGKVRGENKRKILKYENHKQ